MSEMERVDLNPLWQGPHLQREAKGLKIALSEVTRLEQVQHGRRRFPAVRVRTLAGCVL